MDYSDLGIEDHEIEDHFAINNCFHKKSGMSLNDLNCYATSFGPMVRAINMAYTGGMTREEAHTVLDKAIGEYTALNAALDLENAA